MHGYFWLPVKGKIKVNAYNTHHYSATSSDAPKTNVSEWNHCAVVSTTIGTTKATTAAAGAAVALMIALDCVFKLTPAGM